MPAIINSDDGVISGTSGLKTAGANDGITAFQQNGTESARITAARDLLVGTVTNTNNSKIVAAGVIESTTGGIRYPDGTTQTTAPIASAYVGARTQIFTSNSTFTIPSGVTAVKVTVVGGGGGGGNTGTSNNTLFGYGGGGGGAAIKFLTGLTPGNTLTVTIGSGGGSTVAGGTSSVASGTQTISTVSATGGSAGVSAQTVPVNAGAGVLTPTSGGVGSGGDFNLTGGQGSPHIYVTFQCGCSSSANLSGGAGGGFDNAIPGVQAAGGTVRAIPGLGMFGGSGGAGGVNNAAGSAATGYGTGGGGGSKFSGTTNYAGGAGTAGIIVFEW